MWPHGCPPNSRHPVRHGIGIWCRNPPTLPRLRGLSASESRPHSNWDLKNNKDTHSVAVDWKLIHRGNYYD